MENLQNPAAAGALTPTAAPAHGLSLESLEKKLDAQTALLQEQQAINRKLMRQNRVCMVLTVAFAVALFAFLFWLLPKANTLFNQVSDMHESLGSTAAQVEDLVSRANDKLDVLDGTLAELDMEQLQKALAQLPTILGTLETMQKNLSPIITMFGKLAS